MHGFEREISQEDEQLNIRSMSMPAFLYKARYIFDLLCLP